MLHTGEELSKWMQWLMTSSVPSYHRHYGKSGMPPFSFQALKGTFLAKDVEERDGTFIG